MHVLARMSIRMTPHVRLGTVMEVFVARGLRIGLQVGPGQALVILMLLVGWLHLPVMLTVRIRLLPVVSRHVRVVVGPLEPGLVPVVVAIGWGLHFRIPASGTRCSSERCAGK
jgi:hypothetical protein